MESIAFDLKLMDSVSAPARRAADAMARLEAKAKKAQEALDARQMGSFGKQFEKVGFAAERAAIKHQNAFAGAWAKIGLAAQKAQERAHKQAERLAERQAEKAKEHSLLGGIKEGLGFGKFASAAFVGSAMAEGAMKLIEGFVEGAHKAVEVLAEGIAKAFEESGKQETLRLGEKLSLGKGAGEYREDVGRFSKLTGFDDDKIRALLLPARRAGFNQQSARTAFAAASDVAAGEGQGGNFGRVQELMQAFEHIKLKGGVQERLLPNLGVDVKGFYADLAKSLKVGVQTAKKMAEEGKVDPQLLLNTIFKGIEAKQGGKLGTGAIAYSNTFEARLAKVQNLPNEYLKTLVDSAGFQKVSDTLGKVLERLDPESPTGARIVASLERMFNRIVNWLKELTTNEGLDKLEQSITGAVEMLESAVALAGQLVDYFKAAAGVADTLTKPLQYLIEHTGTSNTTGSSDLDMLRDQFNKGLVSPGQLRAVTDNMSPRQRADAAQRLGITVNNHNTFHGVDESTAKKIGDETHRTTTHAVERAAQEGG